MCRYQNTGQHRDKLHEGHVLQLTIIMKGWTDLRSSGVLRSVERWSFSDVLVQRIGPIFKGHEVQEEHRGGGLKSRIKRWVNRSLQQWRTRAGRGGGGVAGCSSAKPPKNEIKKIHILYILWYQKFRVISPSAEIRHLSRLMTSTLEFWKIN
jgi:hypothetical protein